MLHFHKWEAHRRLLVCKRHLKLPWRLLVEQERDQKPVECIHQTSLRIEYLGHIIDRLSFSLSHFVSPQGQKVPTSNSSSFGVGCNDFHALFDQVWPITNILQASRWNMFWAYTLPEGFLCGQQWQQQTLQRSLCFQFLFAILDQSNLPKCPALLSVALCWT